MKLSEVENWFIYKHKLLISGVFVAITLFVFLLWQLGTLTGGITNVESASGLINSDISNLLDNPLNAPYKLLQWLSISLFGGTALAARLPSVLLAGITLLAMFFALKMWDKIPIAIFGVLVLGTSSWFLHVARLGTDFILLPTLVSLLLLALSWAHHNSSTIWPKLTLLLAIAVSLYSPYMIYLLILVAILYHKEIRETLKTYKLWQWITMGVGLLILILPLFIAMILDINLISAWFGVPNEFPNIVELFRNIGNTFGFIFWRSEVLPWLHLGDLAMLDIFTVAMTALGLYYFEQHHKNLRSKLLIFGFFLLIIAVSLDGNQGTYAILLPFVYIFAATGIVALVSQWNEIFPKNPIARAVAILPLALLMLVTISYHYNRYFVAWPRNPETKQAFISDGELLRKDAINNTNTDDSLLIFSSRTFQPSINYSILGLSQEPILVTTTQSQEAEVVNQFDVVYIGRGQQKKGVEAKLGRADRFIVSDKANNNLRFWVYTTEK